MIASWMASAIVFGALIAAAALAAEQALRALGRQGRWPIVAGLVASVAWPAVAPLFTSRVAIAAPVFIGANASPSRAVARQLALAAGGASRADLWLVSLWVVLSAFVFARIVVAALALRAVRRAARRSSLDGVPVLVADEAGPAVLGFANADVVVPAWLAEFDAPLRALVLRHEQEHQRARDPLVLWLAASMTVLAPWSLGVWALAARLRLAVELDCDARVLGTNGTTGAPVQLYGRLLLLVSQRQSVVLRAPALAESNAHLHRRIEAMTNVVRRAPRAALASALALGVLALACSQKVSGDLMSPKPQTVETLAPTVVQGSQVVVTKADAAAAKGSAPSASSAKAAVAAPATAAQQAPVTVEGKALVPTAKEFKEFTVDRPAMFAAGSAQPRYPESLRTAGVEGEVVIMVVIDQEGKAEPSTVKVLQSTNELFTTSVKNAIPNMKFTPATVGGHAVKQLLRLPFVFAVAGNEKAISKDPASGAPAVANPNVRP